ncbi:MAG: S-layer homology domain-containing protein [Candidatus Peregrinibacteria bacterium]|nr:S-layer homology domain-containing protein [Candidatus Peregrinibacteria bacterium]MDZ4245168.1 S-layer homology domain-containing protein [Candidatus Gracilibacteria bacterium]
MKTKFTIKKFLISISSVIVALCFYVNSAYASQDIYYGDALNWAVSEGIVDGSSVSSATNFAWFRPGDSVNRAEMAKMMMIALKLPVEHGLTQAFLDVSPSAWHYDYVHSGKKNNLFGGYTNEDGVATGFFGPRDEVTRGAIAKVLTQAYEFENVACGTVFKDVDYYAWYSPFIDTMCVAGIIRGDILGRARPGVAVTRSEFVTMLYRAAGSPYVLTEEDKKVVPVTSIFPELDADFIPYLEPNVTVGPNVEMDPIEEDVLIPEVDFPDFDAVTYNNFARLNAPTGTCPNGSCAAHIAQFEITPIYDSIIFRGLTLRNDDDSNNFSGRFGTFFLVHEGKVIDTASFSDTSGGGDAIVNFNGFSHVLPKGKRHKLNVLAEIHDISNADRSGSFLKLYIENGGAIDAISNTNGLSVASNNITLNAGPTGPYIQTHIIRKSYPIIEVDNEFIPKKIYTSLNNTKVYKFKMSAHPNGDVEWSKLTFNIQESSGITSSNYKLYVENSGNAINTAASVSGGKVTIVPATPMKIPSGQTVTFILKADISLTNTAQSQNLALTLTAANDSTLLTSSATALSSSDFIWSDISDKNHSLSTLDWTNGFEVDTFDFETQNISYQG